MSKIISSRLDGVSESATLNLNAKVQEMKKNGIDVVNLSAGEPDFNPPEEAKIAVIDALNRNLSKYTPAAGMQELKSLIAEKKNRQQSNNKKMWTHSDVVVSNGGKQALINTFFALINPGDAVIIPSPFWISYPEMVKLAGGVPVIIKTKFEDGFKLTPSQLKDTIERTENLKLIVLTSPNNPTGSMYSKNEYKSLGNVLLEKGKSEDIFIISDEIYDRIILSDEKFCSFLEACPELQERTITVNGLSKSAAMTGWRLGWSVANSTITKAITTIQSQSSSGVNTLSQCAAISALKLPESSFSWQLDHYKKRKDLAISILSKVYGLKILNPLGAFYLFIGIEQFLYELEDSILFSEDLLKTSNVAVVPGTPFGEDKFIRISFATDEKTIIEGCERLVKFLRMRELKIETKKM